MTDEQILEHLDFTPAPAQSEKCSVAQSGIPCGDPARFVITCCEHGHVFRLCAHHRIVVQPQAVVCGTSWFEAVI